MLPALQDAEVRPATDILHDPKLVKRTKPPEHYILAKWGGDSKPRRVTGCTQVTSKNYIAIVAAIYVKIRDTACIKEDACKLRSVMLEGFWK